MHRAGLILALGLALLAPACAGLSTGANRELSSGYLGCPPAEIAIENEQGHEIETWTARCRGRVFHCVRGGGGIFACSQDYVPSRFSHGHHHSMHAPPAHPRAPATPAQPPQDPAPAPPPQDPATPAPPPSSPAEPIQP